MSWRLGAGDEVALYPLWPLTIWYLAMLARVIKDGIVKNCAGGDLAGGKAAHDIVDLVGRAQLGGTVIATGEQAGHQIGRAHVRSTVTNALFVCRLLHETHNCKNH